MVSPRRLRRLLSTRFILASIALATVVLTEQLHRVHGFIPWGSGSAVSRQASLSSEPPSPPPRHEVRSRSRLQVLAGREGPVLAVNDDWKHNHTDLFWAYVSQLQRLRRSQTAMEHGDGQVKKPARSLLYFLTEHAWDGNDFSVKEPLHRAMIQAIRWAAAENDYRLIQQLVDAVINYAAAAAPPSTGLLDPRILGEAIRGLAGTTASVGKIKALWRLAPSPDAPDSSLAAPWERSVGPMEVNAMLQALAQRHKVRACLEMYAKWKGVVDAYSLSIVLHALRDSIVEDSPAATSTSNMIANSTSPWLEPLQSPCWQWNEAVQFLESPTTTLWNNPAVTALLQLNERAHAAFPQQHDSGQMAVRILDWMQQTNLSPDQQTCTLILSSLNHQWSLARSLVLPQPASDTDTTKNETWKLPTPNVYMVSAAMSVCARNGKYSAAMELLQQLGGDDNSNDSSLLANTWVYNSLLQAFVPRFHQRASKSRIRGNQRHQAQERVRWALNLLERMESSNVPSDQVTYNIMFSLLTAVRPLLREQEWAELCEELPSNFQHPRDTDLRFATHQECLCVHLLNEMCDLRIPRDAKTYKHLLQALQGAGRSAVMIVLHRALEDNDLGRGKERMEVFHAALGALAGEGDVDGVLEVYSLMESTYSLVSAETTARIVIALGHAKKTKTIPVLLLAVDGQSAAKNHLASEHGLRFNSAALVLDSSVFTAAIGSCLAERDFESAKRILVHMQGKDLRPSDESLQQMARAYASMAMTSKKSGMSSERNPSAFRALNAYSLVKTMDNAPVKLLSTVSKACGATGFYDEAQSLLRVIHKSLLEKRLSVKETPGHFASLSRRDSDGLERVATNLHRSLLRSCAVSGNVTVALSICEEVQYLSRQLSWTAEDGHDLSSIGMAVPEWKSLLVAASKSGHWKVCLSTLQLLRPHLEAAHPSSPVDSDKDQKDRDYSNMESALSTAVKCLALRGQYAWIVRAIDDWLVWGGRRPPKAAVFVACRALSSRGRGSEVASLLARCVSVNSSKAAPSKSDTYVASIFSGAISALHSDGLYDAADDVFIEAVSRGFLPFSLKKQAFGAENRITLDLHGMNVAMAHSAVRIALQREVTSASQNQQDLWDNDLMIVTGRGKRSAARMRPVIRPEVQRMLVEEFYPPLSTTSVPGNMGALRVSSDEIADWLNHQRQQKGARMQSIATVLRSLSSGDRLRAALTRAAADSKGSDDENPTL